MLVSVGGGVAIVVVSMDISHLGARGVAAAAGKIHQTLVLKCNFCTDAFLVSM